MPRVLAARRAVEVEVAGGTLGDVARALGEACPALRGPVIGEDGWLVPGYQFAVGERFTRDRVAPVGEGDAVLLLASAAGG